MKQQSVTTIEIPRPNIQKLKLTVVGDTPLITHRWSEKARKMILDKQLKKAQKAREKRNPKKEFQDACYKISPRKYGLPAVCFKASGVGACRHVEGLPMTHAKQLFHVLATHGDLVEIKSDPPVMREDMVRVGMGVADLRFRPEFRNWQATLTISYNADNISAEQIVNLFNLAGTTNGVGEMRPERTVHSFGMYHVETGDDSNGNGHR